MLSTSAVATSASGAVVTQTRQRYAARGGPLRGYGGPPRVARHKYTIPVQSYFMKPRWFERRNAGQRWGGSSPTKLPGSMVWQKVKRLKPRNLNPSWKSSFAVAEELLKLPLIPPCIRATSKALVSHLRFSHLGGRSSSRVALPPRPSPSLHPAWLLKDIGSACAEAPPLPPYLYPHAPSLRV